MKVERVHNSLGMTIRRLIPLPALNLTEVTLIKQVLLGQSYQLR